MTATGTLILMVGMPVWIFGLFTGGEFLPSSLLTHGVGLAIGMAGTVALGGVRSDAWKALAFVAILLVICRLVTRPEANVNLAFGQWQDLEPSMRFEVFILGLLAAWAVGLKLADLLFVIGVRRWTAQTR